MSEHGEHDDELEAAVEAEWQRESAAAAAYNCDPGAGFTGVEPRESIRARLIQERKEAQEARIRDLQERQLRRELGRDGDDSGEDAEQDEFLGGLPYLKADYEAAGKLHRGKKMTVRGIEQRRELSTKRAHRIYRQFKAEAVVYDDAGLHPGPGYRWDQVGLDQVPQQFKLIRA